MGIQAFEDNYEPDRTDLNVVICVNQRKDYSDKSPINHMLENVQLDLKRELPDYRSIHIAFVYETPGIDAKDFTALTEESLLVYKEPCEKLGKNNTKHLLYMGLAMLEARQKKLDGENRLYFLTDGKLSREAENELKDQLGDHSVIRDRFKNLVFKPVLYTNQRPDSKNEDVFSRFFREYAGDIMIYE